MVYDDGRKLVAFKRAIHPHLFLRNCNHRIERAASYELGFGHVRWGTHGDTRDSRNAHPFFYEEDGVHYTFAHNGIISNYRHITPNAVVDSECFGPLIANKSTMPANGSAGLVWFEESENHEPKMFIYRRNQNLGASRVTFLDGTMAVLVHSRRGFVTDSAIRDLTIDIEKLTVTEGTAYEVLPDAEGLSAAWVDYVPEPVEKRWDESTRVSSTYRGG